jgi:hypothetical protein
VARQQRATQSLDARWSAISNVPEGMGKLRRLNGVECENGDGGCLQQLSLT